MIHAVLVYEEDLRAATANIRNQFRTGRRAINGGSKITKAGFHGRADDLEFQAGSFFDSVGEFLSIGCHANCLRAQQENASGRELPSSGDVLLENGHRAIGLRGADGASDGDVRAQAQAHTLVIEWVYPNPIGLGDQQVYGVTTNVNDC